MLSATVWSERQASRVAMLFSERRPQRDIAFCGGRASHEASVENRLHDSDSFHVTNICYVGTVPPERDFEKRVTRTMISKTISSSGARNLNLTNPSGG
jgi:hypothetical protein